MKSLSLTSFIFFVLVISFAQSAPLTYKGSAVLDQPPLAGLIQWARDEVKAQAFVKEGVMFDNKSIITFNLVTTDIKDGAFVVNWDIEMRDVFEQIYNVKFDTTTAAGTKTLSNLRLATKYSGFHVFIISSK